MKPVVQLRNVSKVIRGKKIIDDLSFDVNEGEVFGFLGPNGAGKTTTIRMIVGLIRITEGTIAVCGKDIVKQYEEAIAPIGAIVENPEMYKFLTGYQNLQQVARMVGASQEKIDEVIALVRLKERIHDKVKTYSLGMRQRLGVAQSLLSDPKVLILDEPTNGLDPAGIREFRDHLRRLSREKGIAVIVSSHMLSEMEMMCDRIAIIQKGKLIDIQDVHTDTRVTTSAYLYEVDDREKARKALEAQAGQYHIAEHEDGIILELEREQLPQVLKQLVEQQVKVYEVKSIVKSLEDRFLEITNKEGETADV